MSVLQQLRAAWELVSGRWTAFELRAPGDWAEATAMLTAVRGEELHRVVDDDPWASPAFAGTRPPCRVFAVRDRDDGRIVGVLQGTQAQHLMGIAPTVAAYALDRLDAALLPRTWAVIFFALRPQVRKSAAGLALLAEACRVAVAEGAAVTAFIAEPALLRRYLQLGARVLAPMRASAYGGWRIPLVLLLADRARFEAVNSPLRWFIEADAVQDGERSLAWLRAFEERHGHIDAGVAVYDPAADDEAAPAHALLSRGMDEDGLRALLDGSLVLEAGAGDRILARGDGGAILGVVVAGLVQVVIGDRVIAALGRGEVFGEVAFATGLPRSADLVAASPGTQLLQFSPAALASLPPAAQLALWRNLAWCLARRLVERTAPRTSHMPTSSTGASMPRDAQHDGQADAALAAARRLSGCWLAGEHLDELPAEARPVTADAGRAVQAQWAGLVGDGIGGWKIAATSVAGQQHIGVSGPLAGPVFAGRVRGDGAVISLAHNRMRVAECEIVFGMGRTLAPRPAPYTRAEVLAAVATVHPGIEVPDSRFLAFERAGEAQLIADCACCNDMVLGTGVPVDAATDPRVQALPELQVSARVSDGRTPQGQGRNVLGDPVEALVWLVNELRATGRTLAAGQFVTTGACVVPIPVLPGDRVEADHGWIGRLSVRFA